MSENWTQKTRRLNLEKVQELIKAFGGVTEVYTMKDEFLAFICKNIGCRTATAQEYWETIMASQRFLVRMNDKTKQLSIADTVAIAAIGLANEKEKKVTEELT